MAIIQPILPVAHLDFSADENKKDKFYARTTHTIQVHLNHVAADNTNF